MKSPSGIGKRPLLFRSVHHCFAQATNPLAEGLLPRSASSCPLTTTDALEKVSKEMFLILVSKCNSTVIFWLEANGVNFALEAIGKNE